jgi:hypothetical protein
MSVDACETGTVWVPVIDTFYGVALVIQARRWGFGFLFTIRSGIIACSKFFLLFFFFSLFFLA